MTVNRATRKSRIHVGGANRLHHKEMLLRGGFEHPRGEDKKEESPWFLKDFLGLVVATGLEPVTPSMWTMCSPHVVQSVEPLMIVFKSSESLALRAFPHFFIFWYLSSNLVFAVFILDLKTVFTSVFIRFEYCLHCYWVSSFFPQAPVLRPAGTPPVFVVGWKWLSKALIGQDHFLVSISLLLWIISKVLVLLQWSNLSSSQQSYQLPA